MERETFNQLATLHALDLLDGEGQQRLKSALAEFPELARELGDWSDTAAAIAYSAPSMPLPEQLQERLFERIDRNGLETERSLDLAELQQYAAMVIWEDYQLVPGVKIGAYRIDRTARQMECFLRAEAATVFPNHRHFSDEEILILEGELEVGDRVYRVGDRVAAVAGTAHRPKTQSGCLVFLRTSLDNEILE
ncbi:cupin domain-containing protein [Synechococcus sp. PCC 7336]|uniref:cupin domain-containing protein n=1 Tax=Synechococcus sp. PCC 7336 TaxID=195250 RepID=UPI000347D91E|nr:cupin domain-containing protein [Synechococcus sp. PCC 7336]